MVNTSCPGLCTGKDGPLEWLNWVLGTCGKYPFFSKQVWVNYPEVDAAALDSLLPWGWRVKSTDPHFPCPSNVQKLASFAVINVIMSICNLILGRRDVVEWLSFRRLGNKDGYPYFWPFFALLTVTLNLLANFINALLVKRAPGFSQVPLADLALFWFTRPRLAWMATALVKIQKERKIYTSLATTSLLAEAILQALGSFYLGKTAVYGLKNGFFSSGKLDNVQYRVYAQLMYVGAFLWLVTVWGFWGRVLWTYTSIGEVFKAAFGRFTAFLAYVGFVIAACCRWVPCRYRFRTSTSKSGEVIQFEQVQLGSSTTQRQLDGDADPNLGLGTKLQSMTLVFDFMFMPFVGQWLFWVGFIGFAGNKLIDPISPGRTN
jgi:hypothetical protein